MTAPAPWYPAHHCGHAEHTLRWGQLGNGTRGWKLRHRGAVIAALAGYPDGAPANTQVQAIAWADSLLGPQQWIQKPPRSGAHHTHAQPGQTCTTP